MNKTNICNDDSNKNILYKYEYNQKYYEKCLYGNLKNVSPIKNCSCDLEKCSICPNEPLKENLCIKCNNNYYPKENDILNIDKYVTCYKDPIWYYLDKNESIIKSVIIHVKLVSPKEIMIYITVWNVIIIILTI